MSASASLIVCMGVSGCGKTTLAQKIANAKDWLYLDADDFHSARNKSLMRSGIALSDIERKPWMDSFCNTLTLQCVANTSCVVAHSALGHHHRERLRALGFRTVFLFLDGERDTIHRRMLKRRDHFMPVKLLDSQYATLQRPEGESDVIALDVDATQGTQLTNAIFWIEKYFTTPACG